ncbi:ATP-binding protein [Priestia megaterium]|uniref:ATP-binding protein n=1 Tax=Priestia megaterium TaxID=1404 RepID=UPI002E1A92FA|nr:ATP-binding protein [Priestia megaterium]
MKHLGEPFYSIKEDGIGLGLMICFNIIQQHKGTLSIESEVNKGTSVEICLPLD